MRTKTIPLQIKSSPTDGSGTFTGFAATFGGEPDHQGDVIEFGAFAESIVRWRKLGDMPPVGFNHNYTSASSRIGKLTSMQEINEGLLVSGVLHLKSQDALDVYEAMLTGSLDQMSIGYAVIAEHKRSDGVNVLTRLDLIEVSLVPMPANPRARVLAVKSALPTVVQQPGDVRRVTCTTCGRFSEVPVHPENIFGTRVFVGAYACGHGMFGYTPSTWGTDKHVRAMRTVRGRMNAKRNGVESILATLRDNGAPAEVLKSAMSSAKFAVADPEYSLEEFGQRVHDIIDAHTSDEPPVQQSITDRNLVAALDELESSIGTKRRGQEQSPAPTIIELRRHLEQRHASQFTVEAVERMNLRELLTAHAVAHPDGNVDFR